MKEEAYEHTYTGVLVYSEDRVYVPAISDDLAEEGVDHALVFRWDGAEWGHWPIETSVGGVCMVEEPEYALLVMGVTGEVTVISPPEPTQEFIDPGDQGPSELVPLRDIRLIGDRAYVAGMARHVYRRDGRDAWTAIDGGVFVPREQRSESVGFNSIDGFREDHVYAVGYKGEIWTYDGREWREEESPTNLALTSVLCLDEDEVVIVGLAGTIIRGSRGSWRVIAHDATEADFWDSTLFDGRVYLASDERLFELDGENLEPVEMGLSPSPTTMYVDSVPGAMWAVGQKDMVRTMDGETWEMVETPG